MRFVIVCSLLAAVAEAGSSSATPPMSSSTQPFCGDGNVDPGEECDGGSGDCQTLGYAYGTLQCAYCSFDASGCSRCGDGNVDSNEECDSGNVPQTCQTLGYNQGTLGCDIGCVFDKSGCSNTVCGDGNVEPGEDCDSDIVSETCQTLGFTGGMLVCDNPSCLFDTSGCITNPRPRRSPSPIVIPAPAPKPSPRPVGMPLPVPKPSPRPVGMPLPVPKPSPRPVGMPLPIPKPSPRPVGMPLPVPKPSSSMPGPVPEPSPSLVGMPIPVPAPTPSLVGMPLPVPAPTPSLVGMPIPVPAPTPSLVGMPVQTPEPPPSPIALPFTIPSSPAPIVVIPSPTPKPSSLPFAIPVPSPSPIAPIPIPNQPLPPIASILRTSPIPMVGGILGNPANGALSAATIVTGNIGVVSIREMCTSIPGRANRVIMPFPTTTQNSSVYNIFIHAGLAAVAGLISLVWLTVSSQCWSLYQIAFIGIALNAGHIVSGGMGLFEASGLAVGLFSVIMYGLILYRLIGRWKALIECVQVNSTVWLGWMWQGVRQIEHSREERDDTHISAFNGDDWWTYNQAYEKNVGYVTAGDDVEEQESTEPIMGAEEEGTIEEAAGISMENVADPIGIALREEGDRVAADTAWYFVSLYWYYTPLKFLTCIALPSFFVLFSESSCARVSSVYCFSVLVWTLYVLLKQPLCSIATVVLEILNSACIVGGLIPHILGLEAQPFEVLSTVLAITHLTGSIAWSLQYRRVLKDIAPAE